MNQKVTPATSLNKTISTKTYAEPQNLSVSKVRDLISQSIQPIHAIENLPVQQALGRVLAEDIVSGINVPAHNNSAMDGYAFAGKTLSDVEETNFSVIGKAFAGRAFQGVVAAGECVRIMTGAVMPDGCDTVIPLEVVAKVSDVCIHIAPGSVKPGSNRRMAGEDLAIGKIALRHSKILRPADLGLMASLGIATVPVQRRLRVAFFSTGDELRSVDQPLDAGCIYDSNRYTLHAMLTELDCDLIDMGLVKDDTVTLEASFRKACEGADVVITTGGVSVGDADYIRQTMAQLGDVAFWSVAMRPGRPMAFGKIYSNGKSAYVFGLPGNPVAVMVSFYFFVKQALQQLQGAEHVPPLMLKANSKQVIKKRSGRTEFQRGIAETNAAGELEVSITGSQGSGILRSMSEANCFIILEHDQEQVNAGDKVMLTLFDGLR